jgi:flagellar motor switch protein FliN/FliY
MTVPLTTTLAPPATADAYARALFEGAATALSALLGRPAVLELAGPLRLPTDPVAGDVAAPWLAAHARIAQGLGGVQHLLFAQGEIASLVRAAAGEPGESEGPLTAEDEDAAREIVGQMLTTAATALQVFSGRPVAFDVVELRRLPGPDWTPEAAAVAVGRLTVDGTPWATVAVSIPASAVDGGERADGGERDAGGDVSAPSLDMILDISMPVTVELGRTRMLIRDILALGPGSVIELDKLAGEPVDLLVNDRPIARGEVVVIDENFGVRLTEISHASERIRSLG